MTTTTNEQLLQMLANAERTYAEAHGHHKAGKIELTDAQVSIAARQIISGQRKLEDVLEKANVNDSQLKTLQAASKNYQDKISKTKSEP